MSVSASGSSVLLDEVKISERVISKQKIDINYKDDWKESAKNSHRNRNLDTILNLFLSSLWN